jgi:hypothetical protein
MDSWLEQIQALLSTPANISNSLVHIKARPHICGLFCDGTRICAVGDNICSIQTPQHQQNLPIPIPTPKTVCAGLANSGANLCMMNKPNLLVDVQPCAPFTIAVATPSGQHSQNNVCRRRGLLPLPLLDSSFHYQTCYINPHTSDTFMSPQAIINSSNGSLDKWQMEGYTNGQPVLLTFYSPSGLLKISIWLEQQDGLYYCTTDTFTVDTNPWSNTTPFVGHLYHVPYRSLGNNGLDDTTSPHIYGLRHTALALIEEDSNNESDNKEYTISMPPTIRNTPPTPTTTASADKGENEDSMPPTIKHTPPPPTNTASLVALPTVPKTHTAPPVRSRLLVRPPNKAHQLELELWAA